MDKNLTENGVIPVTIVMPVFNAGKYLKQSIGSILGQTFREFIFMIIDDGSTDNSVEIINSYKDPRIKLIRNKENIGLVNSLNNSIDLTSTEYYARMDADDIAVPERLAVQIDFMKHHPEVGVCGGKFEIFGNENVIPEIPLKDGEIKASLLFGCQILHPSVMIRTELLKKNNMKFGVPFAYDDEFGHKLLELEDFALWHKLKGITHFENIDQVLIEYRMEGQNFTTQKQDRILERKKKYYKFLLKELDIVPSENNLMYHISLNYFSKSKTPDDLNSFRKYLTDINIANEKHLIYPVEELKIFIENKWDQLFFKLTPLGVNYVLRYWKISGKIKVTQVKYYLKYSLNNILKKE
jgi:glycosyltransferase involved in cell wall biosynthesis